MPYPTRIKVAALAAVLAATCAACASTTPGSGPPIAPVSIDCGLPAPVPGSVDGVFTEIPGFTVSEICPGDVGPGLADPEVGAAFDRLAAGLVSQNGDPILRVLAGQLKSGSGDAFVHEYLEDLSAKTREGVGLPSETEQLGGHIVTHFNLPQISEGYIYADGPTAVIAYFPLGSPPATVEAALSEILGNV